MAARLAACLPCAEVLAAWTTRALPHWRKTPGPAAVTPSEMGLARGNGLAPRRKPASASISRCLWRPFRQGRPSHRGEPGSHQLLPGPGAGLGQNPQIAFANEQIREAFAQLRGARFLWLPSIQAGINYQNHEGPLQNSNGTITVANRSALEAGLGMYAVGGGAPAIPGVTAKFAMADAVFQPRIAEQQAAAQQHAAAATTHDFLLFVAVAYLDLLRAFQQQAIARETLDHTEQLAALTAAFARSGQGFQADADRAQTELAVREMPWCRPPCRPRLLRPAWRSCSICRLAAPWCPRNRRIVPIELVLREAAAGQLVADGLLHRPELAAKLPRRRRRGGATQSRAIRAAVAECAPGCEPRRIWRRTGLHGGGL